MFFKKLFTANQSAKEVVKELEKEKGYFRDYATYGCYHEKVIEKNIPFNSNCKNCGAPLKPHKHKCEYCATYQNC